MRKKSTRLLSAALAVCMTVTVLPMSAFASGEEELESSVSSQETTAALSEETGDVAIDETNFPDEVFREYVKWFDRDSDNILNQDELAKVKELELDPYGLPYGKKISSLEGIKYFTSLETLSCYDNQLSTLDVSSNHKLKNLYCHRNRLSKLVLSKNSELETLSCYGNHLSALDVSSSPELKNLDCRENNLSELDVSQNTELVSLDCSHNKLSALDVSSNSKLNSLDCRENELSELKVSNNPALVSLTCNDNYLSELDVHSSPELKNLYCQDNRLGELDVSENPKLKELYCQNNQLSALDLRSGNQHLKYLFCYHNQLTSLDIDGSDIKLFGCLDNSYNIVVDENNCYDLSKLQGNFDASKVENPQGGSFDAESNILTVDPGATEVTYTYNCGTYTNGESLKAKFTLNVTHHTHHYGDWLHDEAYHWHECTDHDCPEPEESVKDKAEHTFDDNAKDKDCNTCGYVRPLYTVTTVNATAKLEDKVLDAPVAAGTEVTLTAGDASEGKTFAGWKLYNVSDTESEITDETELANLLKNGTETTATLTMPAYNVKAEPYYSDIPYNIKAVNCTVDKTEAAKGDTVTATRRKPEANERFIDWTVKVNGVEQDTDTFLKPDADDPAKVSFVMPAENVEIKANFEGVPTLNIGDHVTANIDDNDASVPSGSTVPVGETVHLTAIAPEGQHFIGWTVKVGGEEQKADTFLTTPDENDPTKVTFTMPTENVEVKATFAEDPIPEPDPVGPSDTGNIQGAISAVVIGAAAGAIIYEAGTGIYRVINMPGIPMPSNRIELAELLWEHAGKPEPVSTALYSDIDEGDTDAQKAARWAVEQDLMKDDADNNKFHPAFPVSKLRTCLTWNAAKEKGLFDKTEE